MAALIYAVLKRNTGFAVREYYDLGVMLPSIVLALVFLVTVLGSLPAIRMLLALRLTEVLHGK